MSEIKTITFRITGIRPLLLHNGLLADPTYDFTKRIKKITSKGSKKLTDADYEERDKQEWLGSLYWSDVEDGIVIPSDNLERCIQEGARKAKRGKDFAAAVFVTEPEVKLIHRLSGKSQEEIRADKAYTLRKGVKVQQSRIIRIRPMIPTGWRLEFSVEFDNGIVNSQDVKTALGEAGALVGLGDWRPKFGRFTSEVA